MAVADGPNVYTPPNYSAPVKKKLNRSRMAVSLDLLANLLHLPDDVSVQGVTVENNDFGQPILYFILDGHESIPSDTPEVDALFETVIHREMKFKEFKVR